MKKLLLLLLCVPLIGFGQGWTKYYNFLPSNSTGNTFADAMDIQQTTDGGFIFTGFSNETIAANTFLQSKYLIKTNVFGDTIWTRFYHPYPFFNTSSSSSSMSQAVEQTDDGGYIICGTFGDSICVLKTDSIGNQEWEQFYDGCYSSSSSNEIKKTSDGGYIICGSFILSGVFANLIKINQYGNIQWVKNVHHPSMGNNSTANGVLPSLRVKQTTDGGYVMGVRTHSGIGGNWNGHICKTDSLGNSVWVYNLGTNYPADVDQTNDGGYIVGSGSGLYKLDDNGSFLWLNSYSFNGGWPSQLSNIGGFSRVIQTSDRGYFATGIIYDPWMMCNTSDDIIMVKTDSLGNLNWIRPFGEPVPVAWEQATAIGEATDGEYYVLGNSWGAGVPFILKLDTAGNIATEGCTDSLACNYDSLATTMSNGCECLYSSSLSVTDTACNNYYWNGTNYNTSGAYTWTGTNSVGCDSIVTLYLTVDNSVYSTSSTTVDTACEYYTWNGLNLITSGIYDTILINAVGCDSLVNLDLLINDNPTTSIILGSNQSSYLSLETYNVSQTIGSVFNWQLDNGGIIINGQTTNSIEVQWGSTSGTYELYIIETDINGCIGDTIFLSVNVSNTTNVEYLNIDKFTIYPNPSQDVFNVEFTSLVRQDLELRIINSIGEIVYMDNVKNHIGEYRNSISLEEYSKAIYFLEIQTDNGIVNKKLILQ